MNTTAERIREKEEKEKLRALLTKYEIKCARMKDEKLVKALADEAYELGKYKHGKRALFTWPLTEEYLKGVIKIIKQELLKRLTR